MAREYEGIANALASRGRNGDSMMIHVSPMEVEYLERIAPSLGINLPGGKLPINPDTGQPEAFPFLLGLLGIPAAMATSVVSGIGGAGSALLGGLTGGAIGAAPIAGTSTLGAMGSALMGSAGTATTAGSGFLGAGSAIESGLMGVVNTFGGGGWQGFLEGTLGEGIAGALTGGGEAALVEPTALEAIHGVAEGGTAPTEVVAGPGGTYVDVPLQLDAGASIGEGVTTGEQLAQQGAQGAQSAAQTPSVPTGTPTPTPPTTPTGAEGVEQAVEQTLMEQVNEGIQLIQNDPLQALGKAAEYGVQTVADNPYETMGLAMAADALLPGGGGGEEGDGGETWASQQEGEGDPFTYAEKGTGGGDIISRAPADYIADSPVQWAPSEESFSGMPGAKGRMLARRGGVMDEGIGMMQAGSPEMAAPVGIAEREIPGQEEAIAMFQEGDFGEDMSIAEMKENLPPGMTVEDMVELYAMLGPDMLRGMV